MRIPSNEPSSLILSQTKYCQKLKMMTRKCLKKVIQKGWCNKPTKLQFQAILIRKISMLSKRYESTEVVRRTWLHVPLGTHSTTSSDTYHFVVIWKKSQNKWKHRIPPTKPLRSYATRYNSRINWGTDFFSCQMFRTPRLYANCKHSRNGPIYVARGIWCCNCSVHDTCLLLCLRRGSEIEAEFLTFKTFITF